MKDLIATDRRSLIRGGKSIGRRARKTLQIASSVLRDVTLIA